MIEAFGWWPPPELRGKREKLAVDGECVGVLLDEARDGVADAAREVLDDEGLARAVVGVLRGRGRQKVCETRTALRRGGVL